MLNGLPKSIPVLGISTDLQEAPQISEASLLTPTFMGSGSVPCWFPDYQSGYHKLPLVQVICFCGFHRPGLNPFAHHFYLSATGFQFCSVFSCGCLPLLLSAAG
ncbi:hypothetical protein I79_012745 [Cricetulus griseus]|uniref:Uncharacterized protein n=1 Tax=Cricetulus griseus TaxID=10029 RepID=G3HPN0_CRIGR|nr:hypothetical protein I79_012745 [Cricetulus griseus]